MVMKRFVLFALLFLAVGTGWAQDLTTDHLFRVFYYNKENNRIDIPENEHASTKITGMFLVHKDKMVLLGESAKTLLSDTDNLFIEVLDTTQLKPQFFRVIKLKVKKGNREATCWSNSPLGPVDSSKDFIPMVLYPVKDNVYHIGIKDLQKGHYFVMYQEGLNQLMEIYDFDK